MLEFERSYNPELSDVVATTIDHNVQLSCVKRRSLNEVKVNGVDKLLNGKTESKIDGYYAVCLRDVSFCFGRKQVLDNVNLCVPQGKIYALLGSSGSGKTTLLRCVLGRLKVDKGDILLLKSTNEANVVQSFIPGQGVGFMPQETVLFDDFSIKDTFQYFGCLYGLNSKELKIKSEFLTQLLKLPPMARIVSTLSGGQKRRVSLAIALIHEPPLLILDEPTVGVDPILRETIWKYLLEVSRINGTTVIITTHYIEEARTADLVGFLRFGQMLIEDNPVKVMEKFKTSTLEDAFNKICKIENQMLPLRTSNNFKPQVDRYQHMKPFECDKQTYVSELTKLKTQVRKNFHRYFYSYTSILTKLLFPLFQLSVAAVTLDVYTYDVPIAVCNRDINPVYSQLWLESFDPKYTRFISFNSKESALDSVRFGKTLAAIIIPENFSELLPQRNNFADMDSEMLAKSNIAVYQDTTNVVVSINLRNNILTAFSTFTNKVLEKLETEREDEENVEGRGVESSDYEDETLHADYRLPLNFKSFKPDWKQVINYVPEALAQITFFAMTAFAGVSLVLEKKHGMYERTVLTGVGTNSYVTAHIIVQVVILLCQIAVLYAGFDMMGIEANGPVIYTVPQVIINSICGMAFGLLCASFFNSELGTLVLIAFTYFPLMFISGMIWPIETEPEVVQKVAAVLPLAVPSMALEEVFYRGSDFTHPLIFWGFSVSFVWAFIFLFFTYIVFKFKN